MEEMKWQKQQEETPPEYHVLKKQNVFPFIYQEVILNNYIPIQNKREKNI